MYGEMHHRYGATPWGGVVAILSACVVTLIGVLRGIDPDVILWRAVIAAAVLGSITAVANCVMNLFHRSS